MTTATPTERPRIAGSYFVAVALSLAALVFIGMAIGQRLGEESAGPTVELGEMYISGDLEVGADEPLTIFNAGEIMHNLYVEDGPHTSDLNGGEAELLDISSLEPATYTVYCAIEGHRAAGMEAQLDVSS